MPDDFFMVSPDDALVPHGLVLPHTMVQDLLVVAELEQKLVEQLAHALDGERGILTEERIADLVQRYFQDAATTESVARTIRNLPPDGIHQVFAVVDRWRRSAKKGAELMPDDAFAALQRNLGTLIKDYPSLGLMRKAQRLVRDTGNEFISALFVCDLRPIFDKRHQQVEGFVALANLRLQYLRQNGDHDSFEIALTEDELEKLIKEGQKARRKLQVLRNSIPNLVKTQQGSDD